jgi:hypothetical protein
MIRARAPHRPQPRPAPTQRPLAFTAGNEAGTNWAGSILEARLQYAVLRGDVGELEACARRAAAWVGSYVLADGRTDETTNRDFMHGAGF